MKIMKYRIIILIIVLLAVSLSSAYAGSERRIGTSGAQELRIPIGARGTAMGGAMVAAVKGVESIYWNPAGLARLEGSEAMFSHQPYLADIDVNFVGAATKMGEFGTLAAGAQIVSIGDMEETTEDYPDGTGRFFNPTLSVLSLTYSRDLTYYVSFGVTGKFVSEKIFEASATGVAFDVGFIYDPNWRGLTIGMAIKNYGPEMRFSGRGFERELNNRPVRPLSASFDLPSSFALGVAYDIINVEKSVAAVSGDFISNNYSQDAWQGGLEYTYDGKYSVRAGYNYSSQNNYIYGFSVGAGIMLTMGKTNVSFDYSWNENEIFDNTQYFTGRVNF
jgi:hypothetical protein